MISSLNLCAACVVLSWVCVQPVPAEPPTPPDTTDAVRVMPLYTLPTNPVCTMTSRDGRHIAFVVMKGSRQAVMVDGVEGPVFDTINADQGNYQAGMVPNADFPPTFSADGAHFAYAAARAGKIVVVVDGVELGEYDAVNQFVFAPDGSDHAYAAVKGDRSLVVQRGKEVASYAAAHRNDFPGSSRQVVPAIRDLKFSPDSRTLAYQSPDDLVVNGQPLKLGERFKMPLQSMGYIYDHQGRYRGVAGSESARPRGETQEFLTIDGKFFPPPAPVADEADQHSRWNNAVFSADGNHFAYGSFEKKAGPAPSGGWIHEWFLVHDGVEVEGSRRTFSPYRTECPFAINPDGRRVAFAKQVLREATVGSSKHARKGHVSRWLVADNQGLVTQEYESIQQIAFSPGGKLLAHVVQNNRGFLLVENQEHPPALDVSAIVWNTDGSRFAYLTPSPDDVHSVSVCVDGVIQAGHHYPQTVTGLRFGENGRDVSYAASKALYINGAKAEAQGPLVSILPDGRAVFAEAENEYDDPYRQAAAYTIGDERITIPDGQRVFLHRRAGLDNAAVSPFILSPDARHVITAVTPEGWMANDERTWQLLIDGRPGPKFVPFAVPPYGEFESLEHLVRFPDDQTMRHLAVRDGVLHEVVYHLEHLSEMLPTAEAEAVEAMGGLHTLHRFGDDPVQGGQPRLLVVAPNGTLFGAADGGRYGDGVLFRMDRGGSGYKVVHNFSVKKNNGRPVSLLSASDGTIYGTTWAQSRFSTIFKFDPSSDQYETLFTLDAADPRGGGGSLKLCSIADDGTLYGVADASTRSRVFSFRPGTNEFKYLYDSQGPGYGDQRPLVDSFALGRDGALYGVSKYNGQFQAGFLIKIEHDGGFSLLHEFEGDPDDGKYPAAAPVIDADGALYGVTSEGGEYNKGTVYRFAADGYRVLHNFGESEKGPALPAELCIARDGSLIGVFRNGCGEYGQEAGMFALHTDGSDFRVLSTTPGADGLLPGPDGEYYGFGRQEIFRFVPAKGQR